jgi:carboxypeptidase Taq
MGEAYEALMVQMRELDVIGQISGLLGWDQEVMMPPKAAAMRAEQLAWLSKEGHTRMTAPEVGELISAAESEVNGSEVEQGNIRIIRDSYDKATKKPTEFVEEKARHTSKSIVSWTEAREKNDFSIFRDDLAKMIDMSRQLAGYLGYEDNPYDALLDLYESGLCVAKLDPLFAGLRESSVPLIKAVSELENKPDCSWVHKQFQKQSDLTSKQDVEMNQLIHSAVVQTLMMFVGQLVTTRRNPTGQFMEPCMRLDTHCMNRVGLETLTSNQ